MITVHLQNGQTLHFPDGTMPDVMKSAIASKFPDQMASNQMQNTENAVAKDAQLIKEGKQPISKPAEEQRSPGRMALDKFHDLLRNLGAGGMESLRNASKSTGFDFSSSAPELYGNAKEQDYQKMFGVNDQNRNEGAQAVPGIAASFAVPALRAEALAARASAGLAERALRGGAKSAIEGAKQGFLGRTIASEEDKNDQGLKQGLYAGLADLGTKAIGANHPLSNFLRRAAPAFGGSILGYKAGEAMNLPWQGKVASTAAGMIGGHKGGNLARKLLLDPNYASRPFAQDAARNMGQMERREYTKAHNASQRTGIDLRLDEKTKSPIHQAQVSNAAREEENVRKANSFEKKRNRDIAISKNRVANEQFPREMEDKIQGMYNDAYTHSNPRDVEAAVDDLIHTPIYQEAYKKFITNPADRTKYKGVGMFHLKAQDKIQRNIKDQIDFMKAHPDKYSKETIHTYEDFNRDLLNRLDRTSEKGLYKNARRQYENSLFAKQVRGDSSQDFLSRLKDNDKFKELLNSNRGNRPLQRQLIDLRRVATSIDPIDLVSLAKKLPKGTNLSSAVGHPMQTARSLINHFVDKDYKLAAMDVALNPQSAEELARLSRISNPNRLAQELVRAASKITGSK